MTILEASGGNGRKQATYNAIEVGTIDLNSTPKTQYDVLTRDSRLHQAITGEDSQPSDTGPEPAGQNELAEIGQVDDDEFPPPPNFSSTLDEVAIEHTQLEQKVLDPYTVTALRGILEIFKPNGRSPQELSEAVAYYAGDVAWLGVMLEKLPNYGQKFGPYSSPR